MIKYSTVNVVSVSDWDNLVSKVYGRTYSLQQQDGCMGRQMLDISIPGESNDEEMNDDIIEEVNGDEMGVKFKTWLARDPKKPLLNQKHDWELEMFWKRNFYPDLQTLANDLFRLKLIKKGDYLINIDW